MDFATFWWFLVAFCGGGQLFCWGSCYLWRLFRVFIELSDFSA